MLQTQAAATVPPAQAAPVRLAGGGGGRRVLMVAPTSFFADYGCHVRILEEARALQGLGQRVTIVTYRNGRDVPGLDIRRTLPIPWRRDYEVGSSRHKVAFDGLLAMTTLRVALGTRPDVVHGHLHEGALIGGWVARLLGRPLVFDYQGSLTSEMVDHGFLDPAGRWHGPLRRLEGRINRLAAAILTSSPSAVDLLTQEFALPPRRIHTLPDGVDTDRFRPDIIGPDEADRLKRSLGIPPGRRVVAYLGLLAPYQGTDHLLTAAVAVAAQQPDAHFLVMGFPGPDVYAAKARALGLAGRVTFTGRVPYEAAPAHLAVADVAVAPKMSATEGSGKVLNYMAMALPTVAFDTPVSRGYLGALGRYAPLGDAGALADCISGLLADPAAARRLGRQLRARAASRFGWDAAGRRILDVYAAVSRAPAADGG